MPTWTPIPDVLFPKDLADEGDSEPEIWNSGAILYWGKQSQKEMTDNNEH